MSEPLVNKATIEDAYPLTPLQEGLLFHTLYEPETGVYIVQSTLDFQGRMDIPAFVQSWNEVIRRHAALRTTFHWEDVSANVQAVHSAADVPMRMLDWRTHDHDAQQAMMFHTLKHERRDFSLSSAPPARYLLIQLTEDVFRFVWTYHHIILDGWSVGIVLGEVFEVYRQLRAGGQAALPQPPSYRDYIVWLKKRRMDHAKAYWQSVLEGFTETTSLPDARLKAGDPSIEAEKLTFSAAESRQLESFAREQRITVNTLFQTAWALLLSTYSGSTDVVFGTVVSGRPPDLPGADKMAGLFINSLPVRITYTVEDKVAELLRRVHVEQAKAREYFHVPLTEIHRWSSLNRQPLFQSLLLFENLQRNDVFGVQDEEITFRSLHIDEQTNYPMTVTVAPEDEYVILMQYDKNWFEAASVNQLIRQLRALVLDMAKRPEAEAGSLSMLTEQELAVLLEAHGRTKARIPKGGIHQLFEAMAERYSDQPAVRFQDGVLSYDGLNRRANQIAHRLQAMGVQNGSLVAICLERSSDLVAAVLGVLKAGGCYVPLDPAYPADRLNWIVEDAEPAAIISTSQSILIFGGIDMPQLLLDQAQVSLSLSEKQDSNLNLMCDPAQLAYVIYTSGSTGRPKGVELTHRSAVNFLSSMRRRPGIKRKDVLLAVTSLSFDISLLELFLPLTVGAVVVIASAQDVLDGDRLMKLMKQSGITMMQATPATWRLMLDAGWRGDRITALCGGEALSNELATRLLDRCEALWNMYGPTETTVWSTVHRVEWGALNGASVSLGHPIDNTSVYVLDDRLKPVAPGVPGELFIGGEGLARGYRNRPDLTQERFVEDPFRPFKTASRMYRTGDLVKRRENGTLEYIRRMDDQIKLRGYRIELGEIEAAVRRASGVGEGVVLVHEGDQSVKRIVAYVVPTSGFTLDSAAIKRELRAFLPDYMIPSEIIVCESLPLTPNGKVDRKQLLDIKPTSRAREIVEPVTDTERAIAEAWRTVLQVERISLTDNFFDLGGNSLLVMQMVGQIRKRLGVDVPMREVYEAESLSVLAERIVDLQHSLIPR
ncbi:hypothetical protein PCCS19_30010 [Paenibacillus sp. CCS19]|uniref:non-ribosomal peptide synthetase n=1 Tax=Paenibacillus sp. CCS19 TaxID=3158387 RepID=UPI0025685876|nr:amino acid adenylation domain-containing protein [Paenibacillus cellulosilyticus]GMK39946.1 hypothetical protein PCCS19_30010 [Paenibacillus cellulosilyticus]